jgi:hypothetical protein
MRQFYRSKIDQPENSNCFSDTFVAYIPWFIDANVLVLIRGVDGSPFCIIEKTDAYHKVPKETAYLEPMMVSFRFSRIGDHMEEKHFGKVRRNTPMFDIIFKADDTIIERVKDFYEQD